MIRKSIAQIEKMEYPQEVGVVQVGTAREYSLIGENQKVIRWLKRANTTFANVDNNKYTIAIRANVQKDIGISYVNLKEYQQAEKWLNSALVLGKEIFPKKESDCKLVSNIYYELLKLFEILKRAEERKRLANEALEFMKNCGDN